MKRQKNEKKKKIQPKRWWLRVNEKKWTKKSKLKMKKLQITKSIKEYIVSANKMCMTDKFVPHFFPIFFFFFDILKGKTFFVYRNFCSTLRMRAQDLQLCRLGLTCRLKIASFVSWCNEKKKNEKIKRWRQNINEGNMFHIIFFYFFSRNRGTTFSCISCTYDAIKMIKCDMNIIRINCSLLFHWIFFQLFF